MNSPTHHLLLPPPFDITTSSQEKTRAWEKYASSLFRVEDELIEAGFDLGHLTPHMNLLDHWLMLWDQLQKVEVTMV